MTANTLRKFVQSLRLPFHSISEKVLTPPGPGLYPFEHRLENETSRIHLRLDAGGDGLLLVNASRVIHLNATAAFMAFLILNHAPAEQAVRSIKRTFSVTAAQARQDYAQVSSQINALIRPDGACPIHDLDLEIDAPFSSQPSAPYRMDLALTYRCNNDCAHCYNARPRSYPELPTQAWFEMLDKLWEIGIPHVVFTGGEPTLRQDLPDLVAHAQKNGQITGLNTNGRRLSDPGYLHRLVDAGLDHVQITLESHDAAIHDSMVGAHGAWDQTVRGLRNALADRLFIMTNTTLLVDNAPSLEGTLDFLGQLGVPTIGLNALIYSGRGLSVGKGLAEAQLSPLLEIARLKTEAYAQRLIWYTPTQYCNFDPMQLDLGVKGCTAAFYNMCVEPDGSVIPCQSYYQPVGNLLSDPWDLIWKHELCQSLRDRHYVQQKCQGCALLSECGGGCPLSYADHQPAQSTSMEGGQ